MNRQRAKELLPIIEAFANGETIQYRIYDDGEGWSDVGPEGHGGNLDFMDGVEYRKKPKPRTMWVDKVDGEFRIQEKATKLIKVLDEVARSTGGRQWLNQIPPTQT